MIIAFKNGSLWELQSGFIPDGKLPCGFWSFYSNAFLPPKVSLCMPFPVPLMFFFGVLSYCRNFLSCHLEISLLRIAYPQGHKTMGDLPSPWPLLPSRMHARHLHHSCSYSSISCICSLVSSIFNEIGNIYSQMLSFLGTLSKCYVPSDMVTQSTKVVLLRLSGPLLSASIVYGKTRKALGHKGCSPLPITSWCQISSSKNWKKAILLLFLLCLEDQTSTYRGKKSKL